MKTFKRIILSTLVASLPLTLANAGNLKPGSKEGAKEPVQNQNVQKPGKEPTTPGKMPNNQQQADHGQSQGHGQDQGQDQSQGQDQGQGQSQAQGQAQADSGQQ